MQPTRRSARLTSGLKSPPVARKKNQAEREDEFVVDDI
jgi:hypothetical protein